MKIPVTPMALLLAGFAAGWLFSHFPLAEAGVDANADLAQRPFFVSIDEIQKNLVFADEFRSRYDKTVRLSDGSSRHVTLTPMLHAGRQVVELDDNGHVTYMGLDGTTTNGKLMIQLRDADALRGRLRTQGFDIPAR